LFKKVSGVVGRLGGRWAEVGGGWWEVRVGAWEVGGRRRSAAVLGLKKAGIFTFIE
jgi:hypothetical protein